MCCLARLAALFCDDDPFLCEFAMHHIVFFLATAKIHATLRTGSLNRPSLPIRGTQTLEIFCSMCLSEYKSGATKMCVRAPFNYDGDFIRLHNNGTLVRMLISARGEKLFVVYLI